MQSSDLETTQTLSRFEPLSDLRVHRNKEGVNMTILIRFTIPPDRSPRDALNRIQVVLSALPPWLRQWTALLDEKESKR